MTVYVYEVWKLATKRGTKWQQPSKTGNICDADGLNTIISSDEERRISCTMNSRLKKIEALTVKDITTYPVWYYVNDDRIGEAIVQPVQDLPVNNLDGKVVGTQVKLSSGEIFWALIGNVDAGNRELNEHFLTISIMRDGKWFAMARYHDPGYDKCGPAALANFLGLPTEEVFPISYDLRQYVKGNPDVLVGEIPNEPRRRLTGDQLIAMALG